MPGLCWVAVERNACCSAQIRPCGEWAPVKGVDLAVVSGPSSEDSRGPSDEAPCLCLRDTVILIQRTETWRPKGSQHQETLAPVSRVLKRLFQGPNVSAVSGTPRLSAAECFAEERELLSVIK
ncbi:hypothetical protein SKAU_G00029600 [Synaphobranchus kaupii]|uniref:Uncharacterized protein n=1 Tax=Synaphobranchus kaupii TaxID=118154 RepID=A0A9Q1JFM5_SYNKA|nr:hypothetical protein SKAU_G00029600 [Synaphobranchus kaupii]